MADADIKMGEGDSLPLIATTLFGPDGNALDLTGCTVTLERAPMDGGPAVIRPVTPDADQVANTGDVTCKAFDAGTATRGFYECRFIVINGTTHEQISGPNDRLLIIEVTRRPGS